MTGENRILTPEIIIVAAMTPERVIGSEGGLPWHLPEDMQLFKKLTTGSTVIMGHNTFRSIGQPLPNRTNLVLSRAEISIPNVQIFKNFMDALIEAARLGKPVFVIGGEQVYRKAMPLAAELHISWVKESYPGDVFFPEFDPNEWSECEKADYQGFTYIRYRRQ